MKESYMGKNIMDIEEFLKKSSTISVKHMPDSSKYKAKKFSSWKEFWEDAKKGEMTFPTHRTKCECCGEITNPEDFVGAHIVNVHNSREMNISVRYSVTENFQRRQLFGNSE